MIKKAPRDWFTIIRHLMAAGVSLNHVARTCHRSTAAVFHWTEGGEPKDSDARVVLALYKKHCPQQYAEHMAKIDPETPAFTLAKEAS